MGQTGRWAIAAMSVVALALLLVASSALAHVERTTYWPNPAPDTSVSPPAGGAVPKVRTLPSALRKAPPGKTRVVCQPASLRRAIKSIRRSRNRGHKYRPTGGREKISRAKARRLIRVNRRLFKRCRFREIQPAVTASGNNDRVVVMPGVYTEPTSRAVDDFPPECEQYRTTSEKGSGAVSYAYQFHCPNAQNLVAVIGRGLGPGTDPESTPTSRPDPHGIPNEGPCIRCNLQLEGSVPNPGATVVDAGRVESGNAGPHDAAKDVAIKADRADGFVLRRMTMRHAAEHTLYTLEVDGYLLDRTKYFYAGEYGTLTFTSDHGVTRICQAKGHGDAGLYPGGGPDTGNQRREDFYPEQRLNQTIKRCDSHHNNLGYSGTMGNATHVVNNNFFDNTTGIATDSFYAGGHPGFPQDSSTFERNRIYSNNFNIYAEDSDVESTTPVPIGVGILIAGGNDNLVRNNWIYDNWRRGAMLVAVPDAISCAPNPGAGSPPCTPQGAATTSNRNHYADNSMGRAPDGTAVPNGVDFWWDEFPSNRGNCFGPNIGSDGQVDTTTSDPPEAPGGQPAPGFIAKRNCDSDLNVGYGDPAKESVLVACANGEEGCDWYEMPPRPGSQEAQSEPSPVGGLLPSGAAGEGVFPALPKLCALIGGEGGTLTCGPFTGRLS
jgi:hypothetical protein